MTQGNDTRWTIHDYIGSLAFVPNEPKSRSANFNEKYLFSFLKTITSLVN